MSSAPCCSPCPDFFPAIPLNYRYFNQPIEQIPGWDATKSQILFHGANKGLFWQTAPECIDVVTCIKLTPAGLEIERAKVSVIKVFEPDTLCPDIPATDCPSPSSSPSPG